MEQINALIIQGHFVISIKNINIIAISISCWANIIPYCINIMVLKEVEKKQGSQGPRKLCEAV